MFNFQPGDAFLCSLHSSRRNNVEDWNWTTAWPERQLEGGGGQKLVHTHTHAHTCKTACRRWLCFLMNSSEWWGAEKLLSTKAFSSKSCYKQKLLYKDVFTRRASTHRRVYSQKLLHREAFTQRACTHGSFYTQRSLYTDALNYTPRNFHTQKLSPQEVSSITQIEFTNRSFYMEKLVHREVFAQRRLARSKNLRLAGNPRTSFRELTCFQTTGDIQHSSYCPIPFLYSKQRG